MPKLDEWLLSSFNEDNLAELQEALLHAHEPDDAAEARAEAARRALAHCDERLIRYRDALDAGADPATVAGWMAEVTAERERAEHELREMPAALSEVEAEEIILDLSMLVGELTSAPSERKAELYELLGVRLEYHPDRQVVVVEASPAHACGPESVGGGTCTLTPRAFRPSEYSVAA